VLAFSSISLKLKLTDQKQVRTASDVMFRTKKQRIKSEREKKDTKQFIQVPSINRK